jgi:chromosome partitioning protein
MKSSLTKRKFPLPTLPGLQQMVLWVGANAGGVTKTTLAIHIAYEMARRGYDVALLDLDTNVSMSQFSGLPKYLKLEETMAAVFSDDFDGHWPLLQPNWTGTKGKVQVCLGGPVMVQVGMDLVLKSRREYVLADRFQDFPLPHQLVILDCPATLSHLNDAALAVATHLIIPVELTPKSFTGADALLSWYRSSTRSLRLNPAPQVLGFVPTRYNASEASERDHLAALADMIAPQQIHCYPFIRYSCEFKNASGRGVPLHIHRPGHKASEDFNPICDDIETILRTR